ncbi:hypothetical protein F5B20DRAFT_427155 [Whalleya microplaca]|nr:hypothetical protein F5B20DRAFT_427155 [Whalleya microplaca]
MDLMCVTRPAVRQCARRIRSPRIARSFTPRRYAYTNGARTPKPAPKPAPKKGDTPGKPLPFQPRSATKPKPSAEGAKPAPLGAARWIGLFGLGAAALCLGSFTSTAIYQWRTQTPEQWEAGHEPAVPTGRPGLQAPLEFDAHLDKSEWRLGITKLRRRVAARARGHVLEVAVGTGRNFEFYDWGHVTEGLAPPEEEEEKGAGWWPWGGKGVDKGEEGEEGKGTAQGKEKEKAAGKGKGSDDADEAAMLSFTGLDISPPMLDIALTRLRQIVPYMADQIPKKPKFTTLASPSSSPTSDTTAALTLASQKLRILQSDAQTSLPPPPPPSSSGKYDTIIQTFGLCSVRDPVQLLRAMAGALQPETGRIVLLEHGRSYWDLVNGLLDRSARGHFERFGCWWNRDLEAVVEAARAEVPGLEVVAFERPGWVTMGTHVVVELRVRAGGDAEKGEGERKTAWWEDWLPSVMTVQSKPSKPSGDEKKD